MSLGRLNLAGILFTAILITTTCGPECSAGVIIRNSSQSAARFWLRSKTSKKKWEYGPYSFFGRQTRELNLRLGVYDIAIRLDESRTWFYKRRAKLNQPNRTYSLGVARASPKRGLSPRELARFKSARWSFPDDDWFKDSRTKNGLKDLKKKDLPETKQKCDCKHCQVFHEGEYCKDHADGAISSLGVRVRNHRHGVQVLNTMAGSPAVRCVFEEGRWELDPGEVVTHINGKRIVDTRQFLSAVRTEGPALSLSIVDAEDDHYQLYAFINGIQPEGPRFGASGEVDKPASAIRITEIDADSPAASAMEAKSIRVPRKLSVGDLITHINGKRIATTLDYWLAVQRSPQKMTFSVRSRNNHTHRYTTVLDY